MIDELLRAMADENRRRTLIALHEREPSAAIRVPDDVRIDGGDRPDRHSDLVHRDLPELADAGYVTWNRNAGVVARGPKFDAVEPVLELFDESADELPVEWP